MTKTEQATRQALAINKQTFIDRGIESCENCGGQYCLSIAHKRKRRHYKVKDVTEHIRALTDWDEILLLCQICHDKIEKSPTETEKFFTRLRKKSLDRL